MESVQGRFERDWQRIGDDRKVRGLDQQSEERKSRLYVDNGLGGEVPELPEESGIFSFGQVSSIPSIFDPSQGDITKFSELPYGGLMEDSQGQFVYVKIDSDVESFDVTYDINAYGTSGSRPMAGYGLLLITSPPKGDYAEYAEYYPVGQLIVANQMSSILYDSDIGRTGFVRSGIPLEQNLAEFDVTGAEYILIDETSRFISLPATSTSEFSVKQEV